VLAFAVECAPDRRERVQERKYLSRNEQVGIFRPNRMPVHAFSGNRDFRDQIGSAKGYAFAGSAT
jgi:hypothetical protein